MNSSISGSCLGEKVGLILPCKKGLLIEPKYYSERLMPTYDLQLKIPDKPTIVQFNIDLPEPTIREFKYICKKQFKIPMTKVIKDIIDEFLEKHRSRCSPKQTEMF